jgi:hypothetical protein
MAAAPEVQFTALVGVHRNTSLAKFETELEQNLSFLGMILTVVLWIAMNAMFVPGVRFRRVVLAFSVLYSSGAILYTL